MFFLEPPKIGGSTVLIEIGKNNILTDCIDREENCSENLCNDPLYGEFMLKYCTQTCLKCRPKINLNETENINNLHLAANALKYRRSKLKTNKILNDDSLKNNFLNLINSDQTLNFNQLNGITKSTKINSPLTLSAQKNIFLSTSLMPLPLNNATKNLYQHYIDQYSKNFFLNL